MAGDGLAIQPETEASRAAVEATYKGDWWLLIFLTVFSLSCPNWLFCLSSLFASSRSCITLLSVLYSSNILHATLFRITFFLLSLSLSYPIFLLLLSFVTLILLIFSFYRKKNWKNIVFCHCTDNFSVWLCYFSPLSFVEFLETVSCLGQTFCYCMVVQCLA